MPLTRRDLLTGMATLLGIGASLRVIAGTPKTKTLTFPIGGYEGPWRVEYKHTTYAAGFECDTEDELFKVMNHRPIPDDEGARFAKLLVNSMKPVK